MVIGTVKVTSSGCTRALEFTVSLYLGIPVSMTSSTIWLAYSGERAATSTRYSSLTHLCFSTDIMLPVPCAVYQRVQQWGGTATHISPPVFTSSVTAPPSLHSDVDLRHEHRPVSIDVRAAG